MKFWLKSVLETLLNDQTLHSIGMEQNVSVCDHQRCLLNTWKSGYIPPVIYWRQNRTWIAQNHILHLHSSFNSCRAWPTPSLLVAEGSFCISPFNHLSYIEHLCPSVLGVLWMEGHPCFLVHINSFGCVHGWDHSFRVFTCLELMFSLNSRVIFVFALGLSSFLPSSVPAGNCSCNWTEIAL